MSERSLTGYDNEDVTSKAPGERLDEEVFLYDADSSKTICASCDPTGERPAGMLVNDDSEVKEGATSEPLLDREAEWNERWVAGVVPVDYAIGSGHTDAVQQPRYLSNGGRLFFDSTDGLVPEDQNKKTDAYEYEPPANGETVADGANDTCTAGLATYSPVAEGCVDLISSGESSEEAVFVEASENGDSAFLLTSAKLASTDTDSAYDYYDAHVCGAGWECPSEAAVSPPCDNAESCRAAPAGQPSLYGAPSSATFSGPGDAPPTTPQTTGATAKKIVTKAVKCAKGKHRVHGKCVKTRPKRKKKAKPGKKAAAGKAGATGRGK